MPLSDYALDTFVAQDFTKVTICRLRPVGPDFPNCATWLTTFALGNALAPNVKDGKHALAYMLLRRAEGTVEDFDAAAAELAKFVARGSKSVSSYFRVLRGLTGATTNAYQAMEFGRKALEREGINEPHFVRGDGSPNERLNLLYNTIRHGNALAVPAGHMQMDWISNEGFHVHDGNTEASVSFDELRDVVVNLANLAEKISRQAA